MSIMIDGSHGDGWIHLIQEGHDLPRGPLGVLAYLPLAILFNYVSKPWRAAYITASSLMLAFVMLGPTYTLGLVGLVGLTLAIIRICGTRQRMAMGLVVLTAIYVAFLLHPRPFWLPPLDRDRLLEPTWFYLHWAGIAYLFLRAVHVLADVGQGKMAQPPWQGFASYLLFAPTLRMGPIYRYPDFENQLNGDLAPQRSGKDAVLRILTGLFRLGMIAVLAKQAKLALLFGEPAQLQKLPLEKIIAGIYIAPMTIYLWISGYTDLAVGLGRIMGFRVPENFNYPWVAPNLADFWKRWHLTLGSWLRDYIYIPLGGNRRHVSFNYLVTFLFCGLWHGTRPAMALWGLSQGIGLSIWRLWSRYWSRQADASTPLYRTLHRYRLVDSRLSTALAWLVTFHYQMVTITLIMDENHAGYWIGRRLLHLTGLSA